MHMHTHMHTDMVTGTAIHTHMHTHMHTQAHRHTNRQTDTYIHTHRGIGLHLGKRRMHVKVKLALEVAIGKFAKVRLVPSVTWAKKQRKSACCSAKNFPCLLLESQ